jgi:HD-GYP domain-containing protein (c-di-GMP phosphodiesterase class II)
MPWRISVVHHAPIIADLRPKTIALAELVGAFSYALDLTEGQPAGHCVRACWIGSHIGRALGLSAQDRDDLYYTLLLKDLGCSSNAARICELYQADDLAFKQGYKTVGTGLAATIHFIASRTATGVPLHRRAAAIGHILGNGNKIAQELIVSRCTRGADIARSLRFSEAIASGIYHLDEHWDGSGRPGALRGGAIPLASRIALLAQVVDVFHSHAGRGAAIDEVRRRSGSWFDPALVQAFDHVAADDKFWDGLTSQFLDARLVMLAPIEHLRNVDEDYLDDIAAAFGQVIDAKSAFTAGHSGRVANLAASIGDAMGVPCARRRWLHRAALLHDVGKLGVSNSILDKPGPLDDREWESMRAHAVHTQAILGRVGVLADIAPVAAAHHKRLDGSGYPLGLKDDQIRRETRIITVCDYYDALSSDRPYRAAISPEDALAIIAADIGSAVDGDCFDALSAVVRGA